MTEHYIGPAPTNKELGIAMVDEKDETDPPNPERAIKDNKTDYWLEP